jgi:hypothetical protein
MHLVYNVLWRIVRDRTGTMNLVANHSAVTHVRSLDFLGPSSMSAQLQIQNHAPSTPRVSGRYTG